MTRMMNTLKCWLILLASAAAAVYLAGLAFTAFTTATEVYRWPVSVGVVVRIEKQITYGHRGNTRESFYPVYEILTQENKLVHGQETSSRNPSDFPVGKSVPVSYNPMPDPTNPGAPHPARARVGTPVFLKPALLTLCSLLLLSVSLYTGWWLKTKNRENQT